MLSIAALPKPFIGHIGLIQRNAIQSWLKITPTPEIFLFGDEEGVADVAREFGVKHIPEITRNEHGTPLLDHVFAEFEKRASSDVLCYSNCDILLFSDFARSLERCAEKFQNFLAVNFLQNLDVRQPLPFDNPNWEAELREKTRLQGKYRGNTADFFAFRKGMYPHYPPLALGRPYFDTWIIWEARRLGYPVVDVTPCVLAVHQNHFYTAAPGEGVGRHNATEAQTNLGIIGSRRYVYRPSEATHFLSDTGFSRNWSGTFALRLRKEHAWRMTRRCIAKIIKPVRPVFVALKLLPPPQQ
jgi:hypothetical protein